MPKSIVVQAYTFEELSVTAQGKALRALKTNVKLREFVNFSLKRESARLGFPFDNIRSMRQYGRYNVFVEGKISYDQLCAIAADNHLVEKYERSDCRAMLVDIQRTLKALLPLVLPEATLYSENYLYGGSPLLTTFNFEFKNESDGKPFTERFGYCDRLAEEFLSWEYFDQLTDLMNESLKGRFNAVYAKQYLTEKAWSFEKNGSLIKTS